MTRQCCRGRRISATAASILPGALLVLLPKCPMCLAAWFTVATGLSMSAAAASHMRGLILVFGILAVVASYCSRREIIGSIRVTLRAGSQMATSATKARKSVAARKVTGSDAST